MKREISGLEFLPNKVRPNTACSNCLGSYGSIAAYVATVQKSLPAENYISVESLPSLSQGYSAIRVTTLGLSENVTLYVANENNFVMLQTAYISGKQGEKKYVEIIEQIADTITFP